MWVEAAGIARRLGAVLMELLKINRQRAKVLVFVTRADWGIRFPPPCSGDSAGFLGWVD